MVLQLALYRMELGLSQFLPPRSISIGPPIVQSRAHMPARYSGLSLRLLVPEVRAPGLTLPIPRECDWSCASIRVLGYKGSCCYTTSCVCHCYGTCVSEGSDAVCSVRSGEVFSGVADVAWKPCVSLLIVSTR